MEYHCIMLHTLESTVYFGILCLPLVVCPSVILCTVFEDNGLLHACLSRLSIDDNQSVCSFQQELQECMNNIYTNSSNQARFIGGEDEIVTFPSGDGAVLPCRVVGDIKGLEITWIRQNPIQLLSNSPNARFIVRREGNTTFDLLIASVELSDEGVYVCQMNTKIPTSRRVELRVGRPPFLRAVNYEINPIDLQSSSIVITINETQSFYLDCFVTGFPPPFTQWISLVKDIETAMNMQNVSVNGAIRLAVDNVSRDDDGQYSCRASNQYGIVEQRIGLAVQYKPSISPLPPIIHAGLTSYIKIDCHADSFPPSSYTWTKKGGDGEQLVTAQSSLVIVKLDESDYDEYTCTASNLIGTDSTLVEISGRPMRPTILSPAMGLRRHGYLLVWSPQIITPYGTSLKVDNFSVTYRPLNQPTKETTDADIRPQFEWRAELVLLSSYSDTMSYHIRDLFANTTYEVILYGQNSLGKGQRALFNFTTAFVDLSTTKPRIERRKPDSVEQKILTSAISSACSNELNLQALASCLLAISMSLII